MKALATVFIRFYTVLHEDILLWQRNAKGIVWLDFCCDKTFYFLNL